MTMSLYDMSVAPYLQILGGVSGIMEKAARHAGLDRIPVSLLRRLEGQEQLRIEKGIIPFCPEQDAFLAL